MAKRLIASVLFLSGILVTLFLATAQNYSPPTEGVTVAAVGDIGSCEVVTDEQVAASVARLAPDALLTLGDTVYPSGTAGEFRECFDPAWRQFREIIQPTIGNHDYGLGGYEDRDPSLYDASAYHEYFGKDR